MGRVVRVPKLSQDGAIQLVRESCSIIWDNFSHIVPDEFPGGLYDGHWLLVLLRAHASITHYFLLGFLFQHPFFEVDTRDGLPQSPATHPQTFHILGRVWESVPHSRTPNSVLWLAL